MIRKSFSNFSTNIDNYGLLHCTLLKLTLSEYTVEALVVREDEVEDGKETDAFTAEAIFFFFFQRKIKSHDRVKWVCQDI